MGDGIEQTVRRRTKDILNNKIRLESERISVEIRPPVGHVKPLMSLLMNVSNYIAANRQNGKNVAGSISEGYNFTNEIIREDLLGLIAGSNSGFEIMRLIDTKSGGEQKVYNGDIVLDSIREKLAMADPGQAPAFMKSIDATYNRIFDRKIDGTGLFEGEGSIRNNIDFVEDIIEANRTRAEEWRKANGEDSYVDEDGNPITKEEWESHFNTKITRLAKTNNNIETDNVTDGLIVTNLLKDFNSVLPSGKKIKEFSDLGGVIDLLHPVRAARAVIDALTTQKENTSRVNNRTAVMGKTGKLERKVDIGERRESKIQQRSDSIIASMYDEFDLNRKIDFILKAELDNTGVDIKALREWLTKFKIKEDAIPNKSRDTGLLILPTQAYQSLTSEVPNSIQRAIDLNKQHFLATDPAFMTAVHDALFPMYSSLVVGDAGHFNPEVTTESGTIRPLDGLGFGFPVGFARGGTIQSGMLAAAEITYGYRGVFDAARKLYDSKFEKETGYDFVTFFFGGGIDEVQPEVRERIQKTLFKKQVEELDADASGGNVMIGMVQGIEGAGAIRQFFRDLVREAEGEEGLSRFITENYETIYERVKRTAEERIPSNTLTKAVEAMGEDYALALEAIRKIFTQADDLDMALKEIFKSPTMTDLYNAGAGTMGNNIYSKFFNVPENKEKIINSEIIDDTSYTRIAIAASDLLGNLFNENGVTVENGWVKETLFPNRGGNKITNEKLRDLFNRFKLTQESNIPIGNAVRSTFDETDDFDTIIGRTTASNREQNSSFSELIRKTLGVSRHLVENKFYENEKDAIKGLSGVIETTLERIQSDEQLKELLEKAKETGDFTEAYSRYSTLVTFEEARNIKVDALNSYARQAYRLKESSFEDTMRGMFGNVGEEVISTVLNRLNPVARRGFENDFFFNAAGSDHGRRYSPSNFTPTSEKRFRDGEVYSVVEQRNDPIVGDIGEVIEKLTVLELAIKAAEFTDGSDLPEIGGNKFETSTMYDFFKQWETDSRDSAELRDAAITQLDRLQRAKNRGNLNEGDKEQYDVLIKMISKMIDSTGENRSPEIAGIMEEITGNDTTSQVTSLPSALGFLPKTYLENFEGVPSGIVRMSQLLRSPSAARLERLQTTRKGLTGVNPERPFSDEELAYPNTLPEALDDIKPLKLQKTMPFNIFNSFAANLDKQPTIEKVSELLRSELDNFVQTVNNKQLNEFRDKGNYDKILLAYYSLNGLRESERSQLQIRLEAEKVQSLYDSIFSAIKKEKPSLSDSQINTLVLENTNYILAQNSLDAMVDNSILDQEMTVRALTQWGFDAKNRVTDLYSLEADTISSIPVSFGTGTIEEAIQNMIINNDVEAGNLLAWLSGDAEFLGEILTSEGRFSAVSARGQDPNRAMNALVAFSGGDSPALYLSLYAMNSAKRYAISKIMGKDYEITSQHIGVFTKYYDKKLQGESLDASDVFGMEDFVRTLDETETKTIQNLLDRGTNEAVRGYSNQHILKESLRNIPVTEAVAQDMKRMFPNIDRVLGRVEEGMTIESLLKTRSEKTIISKKDNVFINQFGEPVSPHYVLGRVRVKLLPVEKLMAINSIVNKKLMDALTFAHSMGIDIPYEKSLPNAIGGYDPFSSKGSSIQEVRQNAMIQTQAIKRLTKNKANTQVDNRNTMFIGTKAMDAEFLVYDDASIRQAYSIANEINANEILSDLSIEDSNALDTIRSVDKEAFSRAMSLVPFIGKEEGLFNIFKRLETLRKNLRGQKNVTYREMYDDFRDNILPVIALIRENVLKQQNDKAVYNPDNIRHQSDIMEDPLQITADFAVADSIKDVNENTSNPTVPMAANQTELEINSIKPRTDSNEPFSGSNTIDEVFNNDKFAQNGVYHQNFLTVINELLATETINKNDHLLLKAVFNDRANHVLLKDLFGDSKPLDVVVDPEVKAGGRAEVVAARIRVAKDLAESFEGISEFGAVGIILEEIGHIVGSKLDKESMRDYMTVARDLLKNKEGFDKFVELEQKIFGKPNERNSYDSRISEFKKNLGIDSPEYDPSVNNELFGVLFALSALFGNDVNSFVLKIKDNKTIAEGIDNASHYIEKYNRYKSFVDKNFKTFIGSEGMGLMAEKGLRKQSHVNALDEDEVSGMFDNFDGPDSFFNNEGPKRPDIPEAFKTDIHRLDDVIREHTDEEGMFNAFEIKNDDLRRKAIDRFLDSKREQTSSGTLVDSPVFTLMSNLSGGLISREKTEKLMHNLAQPFGLKKFAFMANKENGLPSTILMLLQATDTKLLVSSSAFGSNLPTMQGLGLQLKGIFEPLMNGLLEIKLSNFTPGMKTGTEDYTPYDLFIDMFWASTAMREKVSETQYSNEIKGWQGREAAKNRAQEIMRLAFRKAGQTLDEKTLAEQETNIEKVVDLVEMWAHPERGIWKQIITAQVDSGVFDATLGDRLITEGVIPVKFSDDVFRNDGKEGIQAREELRNAIGDQITDELINSEFVDADLFKVIFADYFERDDATKSPSSIDMGPASSIYSEYLQKKGDTNTAFNSFMRDIKKGVLKKDDLLTESERDVYNDHIRGDRPLSEKQKEAIMELRNDRLKKTKEAQKRTYTQEMDGKLANLVAEDYMMRAGSSTYTFVGEKFFNTMDMLQNPLIKKHLNLDPAEIFGSLMRGQAAQAFDRQVFGNAFGIRGVGISDLIDTIDQLVENNQFEDIMLDPLMKQMGKKRGLKPEEKNKFTHAFNAIKSAYRYSTGTLKWDDKDASSIPFINMLNHIGQLGSALAIGPRLAFASLLEETPMALAGSFKANLQAANNRIQEGVGLLRSKKDKNAFLEGLGLITQDLTREVNVVLQKIGMEDGRRLDQSRFDKGFEGLTKGIYAFTSKGLNSQVNLNRQIGARKTTQDINRLFYRMSKGVSLIDDEGNLIPGSPRGPILPTFNELAEAFQDMDVNELSLKELRVKLKSNYNMDSDLITVVIDMLKNGLFSRELAPVVQKLFYDYGDDIKQKGLPFDKMVSETSFDYNSNAKERAQRIQVINALREILWLGATRYAKQPSVSEAPAVGARALGPLAPIATALNTYSSTVYSGMHRAGLAGMAAFAAAFMGHALSGYLYYKLIQLQMSTSYEDMVEKAKRDPMSEIQDAMMSVPFFGMNQMVIATLLQVLRGQRPSNTQIYSMAGIAMVNRMLQLPTRVANAFAKINQGEALTGAANVASMVPLPFFAIVPIGLRVSNDMLKNSGMPLFDPFKTGYKPMENIKVSKPVREAPEPRQGTVKPRQPQPRDSMRDPDLIPALKEELNRPDMSEYENLGSLLRDSLIEGMKKPIL